MVMKQLAEHLQRLKSSADAIVYVPRGGAIATERDAQWQLSNMNCNTFNAIVSGTQRWQTLFCTQFTAR